MVKLKIDKIILEVMKINIKEIVYFIEILGILRFRNIL